MIKSNTPKDLCGECIHYEVCKLVMKRFGASRAAEDAFYKEMDDENSVIVFHVPLCKYEAKKILTSKLPDTKNNL